MVEWVGGYDEKPKPETRASHIRFAMPLPTRTTPLGMIVYAIMATGKVGEFCRECERLAFCPQCSADLRGKTICHVTMATHYRDTECKFNGNWQSDYRNTEAKK